MPTADATRRLTGFNQLVVDGPIIIILTREVKNS